MRKYDPNPNFELLDLCNELTCETASVVYGNRTAGLESCSMQEIKKNKDRGNLNITVRRSRQSGVARATCPD